MATRVTLALCQLSYHKAVRCGLSHNVNTLQVGLEPTTSRLSVEVTHVYNAVLWYEADNFVDSILLTPFPALADLNR